MKNPIHRSLLTAALALVSMLLAPSVQAQTLNDLYPELATVLAADGAASDRFGDSVSLSGDTLAVGVPRDGVLWNVNQGSVRIFVRSGTSWNLQLNLTPNDGEASDWFGYSVSLSGDTLAVGVPYDDVGANANQGSVRVFVRSGTLWSAQATLTAADGAALDYFGSSVSLSGDTLAVGVPYDDVGVNGDQGSVRVFVRSGTSWSAQATLTAADGAASDYFGYSVSLSGDTLAVGVLYDDVGANADQGSVRVFVRSGTTWSLQATLTAADGAVTDYFGYSISLSGDALAVGVDTDDVRANANQGSVRVFVRRGTTWSAQATLTAAGGAASDYFGISVSLSGDTLAVGAVDDVGANTDQGSVRVFVRSGTSWSAQATLTAADGAASDDFGYSVSLSGDTLAVAVPTDDVGANTDQGSVRIFGNYRVFNATWNTGYDSLVSAIAAGYAGDRLLAGAPAFAEARGIIDASSKRFTFVGLAPLTLSSTALMQVATGTVFEKSPDVAAAGLTVAGKLVAPSAGTLTFEQLSVSSGGQFLQRNSTVLVNQALASQSGGVCYLQGPVLAETVSTAVGGQNRVAGDTDIFANYTNAGSTVIQRGILYIYGSLTNTGTMTGQFNNGLLPPTPGDGYSIGGDYVVSASSSIVLPDPVWWLRVGGDFDVAIDDASRFVMDQATLELTGLSAAPTQAVEVIAADLGPVNAGFSTSNFLLGALRIRAGATVHLVDAHGNAPGAGNEAIYVNSLMVPAGATLVTNGFKVYTRAATIVGSVS
ncbi:MAG: FG-GAP repeat protein, partial [Planctomycetota bacterium]